MEKTELQSQIAAAQASQDQQELERLARLAVENYPEEAFGYAHLAEAFLMAEEVDFGRVELCLAKAAELEPSNATFLLRFAAIKEAQGDFDNAYIVYSKAIDADPSNIEAINACGSYQLRIAQDFDSAIRYFSQAIEVDKDNVDNYLCRAEAYSAISNHEAALSDLDFVLSKGFNPQATEQKISILQLTGAGDSVEPLYQDLVKNNPDSAYYNNSYGSFLADQGRFADALPYLEKVLASAAEQEDDSLNSILYMNLGEAFLQTAQFANAKDFYNRYISHNPTDNFALLRKAEVLIGTGELAEAEQLINGLLKDIGLADEANLLKAQLLIAQGKYAAADDIFKPILQTDEHPQTAQAYFGVGVSRHKQNQLDTAYALLKVAFQMGYLKAGAYIKQHFADYLRKKQQSVLAANQAATSANATSAVMQKVAGVWLFSNLKSAALAEYDPAVLENVKATLKNFAFVITDKGFIWHTQEQAEIYTYKIGKQAPEAAELELIPLDGTEGENCKIKLNPDGGLLFTKEEGELFLLKKLPVESLSAGLKSELKRKLSPESLSLLGEQTKGLQAALFQ